MDREEREARTNRLRGCAEIDVVTLADDVLALDAELRATRAALATAEAERDRLRNIVDVVACATSAEPVRVVDAVIGLGARLARERASHADDLRDMADEFEAWSPVRIERGEHEGASGERSGG